MKIFRMDHAQVLALKDISLDIIRGEFTAIIGSSGAGKSTLRNIMGCIDQPTIGEIFINSKRKEELLFDKLQLKLFKIVWNILSAK